MVDTLKQVGTADRDRERLKYVRKHSSQLVCTCSENAARDAGSLARVNTLKCLTYVGIGEGQLKLSSLKYCAQICLHPC